MAKPSRVYGLPPGGSLTRMRSSGGGGRGTPLYGLYRCVRYQRVFSAVLVINRVSSLAILVLNRVWF